tara:strand:+ start:409 stop:675 length:267 start_codon:yes stop_codon:yes gene_type:complete
MIYAQFYANNLAGKVDEAMGDRSVVIMDARLSSSTIGSIAEAECLKRGYLAWRIFRGESFTRSASISQLNYLQRSTPVRDPVWLSAHN